MKFQIKSSLILVFLFGLTSFQASSQKLYKTTWGKSGTIFGSSVAMFGGASFIENQRGPITIEDLAALDSEAFLDIDEGAVKKYSIQAGINSDHFKNGAWIAPLTLFLSGQARDNANEITVMYAEVFALNGGITLLTKNAVGRYRPYSYNPDVPLDVKLLPTTRRSFFSGHVSHVASLSFFTATVFDDLYPESSFRYAVWAGAIAAPAITGYFRYKAGSHFPTDVMVGYGVGALVGYFIPELHKITKETDIDIIGANGGLGLVYTF